VIYNGNVQPVEFELPEGEWNVVVDNEHAGVEVLYKLAGKIELKPISALVLYRE